MQIAVFHQIKDNHVEALKAALLRAHLAPISFSYDALPETLIDIQGMILLNPESIDLLQNKAFMTLLHTYAHTGIPVLGIEKGAQLLIESGLIPGLESDKPAITLNTTATTSSFNLACLSKTYQRNVFTRHLKFHHQLTLLRKEWTQTAIISPMLWQEMQTQGLNVLHYCDEKGAYQSTPDTVFALANKAGNIMALFSHLQYDTEAAHALFKSMHDYLANNKNRKQHEHVVPLYYYPRS